MRTSSQDSRTSNASASAKKLASKPERERLWRLRKRQQIIDAILREGVTLEFVMNGKRVTARRCASRAQAIKAATEKRKELERAGWATHW
jgi:hypothetical protein